jgi:superfamily II RNA helicase
VKGLAINLVIPDIWQQEAVRALRDGKDVVVHAPTEQGRLTSLS